MDDYDETAFERVLSLNVKAVFHLTKFLRPLLEAQATAEKPSRVINIGSIDGLRVPAMETYAYSASKAAVHQLTRHLAKFLAPTITVNAIAPGPFESRMMHATIRGDSATTSFAAAPMKRLGRSRPTWPARRYFWRHPPRVTSLARSYPVDGGIATLS